VKSSSVNVKLWISSDTDSLEGVTEALGVRPTKTTTKGEARKSGRGVYADNVWSLETGHLTDVEIDAGLDKLFSVVEKHASYLRSLSDDGVYLGIHASIRMGESHMGFTLSNERLKLLAFAGFLFDVDHCDP
jgi:hypothetical protein